MVLFSPKLDDSARAFETAVSFSRPKDSFTPQKQHSPVPLPDQAQANQLPSPERVLVSQSRPYEPMDCSPPGSFVHGIFQVRILESVVISFSSDLLDSEIKPRSPTLQVYSLPSEPPGTCIRNCYFPKLGSEGWACGLGSTRHFTSS